MADWGHWQVTDGVRQQDRLPRPLTDGYFAPDERDFAAMLATAADISERLPFVMADNSVDGSWHRLFERQDLAVMAQIMATRTAPLERAFLDALYRDPQAALRQVLDLVRRLDRWFVRLGELPSRPATELHGRLEELLKGRLGPALAQLPSFGIEPPAAFAPAWLAGANAGTAPPERRDPRQALQEAFSALIGGVRLLQSLAPAYFEESLGQDNHEPAFALTLAFLRLLGDTQRHLNGLTRRHNDFYYRTVLGTREKPARPERVLLAFPVATARVAIALPRGTPVLAASTDGSPPVRFAADTDTFASAMRIGALQTLYFERDPLLSPQREMDFVTRIHTMRPPADPPEQPAPASWSLFGKDSLGVEAGGPAPMGLIVSTPALYLAEGRRQIDLRLMLRPLGGRAGGGAGAVLAQVQCEDWLRADPGLVQACGHGNASETAAQLMAVLSEAERQVSPAAATLFPDDPLYLVFVRGLVRIAQADNPRAFAAPFGRLMARLLLGPDLAAPADCADGVDALIAEFTAAADRVLGRHESGGSETHPVRRLLTESRAYQYAKYLRDAFTLDLSTVAGWHRIRHLGVGPLELAPDEGGGRIGLRLACELMPDDPPIVADPAAVSGRPGRPAVPAARILLDPAATLCAYSLLAPFILEEVDVAVAVNGVRSLKAYNELGMVDPSKPFHPFGPAPRNGASFVIGSYEAALKRVDTVRLRLQWSGLPHNPDGFPEYYRDYGPEWADAGFGATVGWLAGGGWVSASAGAVPLFGRANAASALLDAQSIAVDIPAAASPLPPSTPPAAFGYGLSAQGGFARLQLTGPPGAFGHEAYPMLFARSVGGPFRRRRDQPLNPPYTPMLAAVELDYTAHASIRVSQVPEDLAHQRGEFIDHAGPFGTEEIHPIPLLPEPGPLPRRTADGTLFIGLRDTAPGKPVSLLFHMAERAHRRRRFDVPAVVWSYLTEGGWRRLNPDLVLADTTSALMRSGVVTIQLPDDAASAGPFAEAGLRMPSDGYWLKAETNADPATFPRAARLVGNGLTASRVVADGGPYRPLPQGAVWQLESTPPGLGAIREVQPPAGGHPPETGRQYRARIGERLRHRGRVVTLWDYERLVLEHFPQVERVKCFAAADDNRPEGPAPGNVLLVAVPHAMTTGSELVGERRMLDALSLHEIQTALTSLAPAAARIEVRNAAYDMVQVRGKVRFADNADRGLLLRTLIEDVSALLSPWDDRGQRLGFGWQLNAADVQAFIVERDYVEHVSEFAMLMLSADDQNRYSLVDTASPGHSPQAAAGQSTERRQTAVRGLRHSVPWSLPLPLHWQALEAVQSDERRPARPAGFGMLGVSTTLVSTGNDE